MARLVISSTPISQICCSTPPIGFQFLTVLNSKEQFLLLQFQKKYVKLNPQTHIQLSLLEWNVRLSSVWQLNIHLQNTAIQSVIRKWKIVWMHYLIKALMKLYKCWHMVDSLYHTYHISVRTHLSKSTTMLSQQSMSLCHLHVIA